MIVLIVHETFKALILLRYKTIKGCCMANFEPLKRRGEQKLLPRRDRGHLLFFPNKQGKSTVFSQVNTVLIQIKALKACIYRVFHVLYQNIVSNLSSVSAAGSLLDPPPSIASGGRLFSYPRTKIF
jgi:hypothetical protein